MNTKSKPISSGFANAKQIAEACGVTWDTASKWTTMPEFPAKVGKAWPREPVLQFGVRHMTEHANQIRGKAGDVRTVHIFKKIKKLEEDIRKSKAEADSAERNAEIHKIEYEAKRKQWFHIDQVRRFALLVVQAFDDAAQSVAMVTRDDKAVQSVQTEFDRVRKKLAKEVGEIK